MNSVIIQGMLSAPEVRYGKNDGKPIATASLGITTQDREGKPVLSLIKVLAFGEALATQMSSLEPNSDAVLEGRMQMDKEEVNGRNIKTPVLVISRIHGGLATQPSHKPKAVSAPSEESQEINYDDIPF